MKTFLPLILAGLLATACAGNPSAKPLEFWDPSDTRVHSKLSKTQESDAATAAAYLSQLINVSGTQTAREDASAFGDLMYNVAPGTATVASDQVLTDELAKCVRRTFTTSDMGTTTVTVWYENAEGHVCPFTFTAVETKQSGTLSPSMGRREMENGAETIRKLTINFAAKEVTRQYDEGKIRRMSLTHTESAYAREPLRQPGAQGHRTFTKTVTGSFELNNSSTASFAIEQRSDIKPIVIDDSATTQNGRSLMTVTVGMPFGNLAVSYEALYTPGLQKPSTRVLVNGVEVQKN